MNVALAALEATVHVQGPKGSRAVPIGDFHLLPGSTPQRETVLEPGDLITHVTLPPPVAGSKQLYLKLRDRASYEFALASAAVVLTIAGGKVTPRPRRAGRRRHQAVAIPRGRGRARRPDGGRGELPQGGGSGPARRQAAERERLQGRAGEALPHARAADGRDELIPEEQRMATTLRHPDVTDRPQHAARGRPVESDRKGAVRLRLSLSRNALRRPGRGDDRQRPHRRSSTRRPPRRCPACAPSAIAETSEKSSARPWDPASKASSTSVARRSRTMSFATTASTSRSPWRTRSRAPRPRPTRCAPPTTSRSPTSPPISRPTTSPTRCPPPSPRPSASRASAETPRRRSRARRSSSTRPTSRRPRPTTRSSCRRTIAFWDGSMLTIYEESQGVFNLQGVLAQMFGLPKENVRVITKFVGSGFGSKLWPWTHCALAVAAARQLGKPVKLVISRKMMFQTVGHRPRVQQRVRLGATPDGKLVSLQQDYVNDQAMLDNYHEDCGEATPFMYSVPNLRVAFGRARRNVGPPTADARPRRRARALRDRVGDERAGRLSSRSTRSGSAFSTNRRSTSRWAFRSRRAICSSATRWAGRSSAGRSARPRSAR